MTRSEVIYDIINILTKSGYTDDSRLDPDYIGFMVDEKRAKEIRDSYNRNPLIDPIWLQDYGIVDMTEVNFADDQSFTYLDCTLSKVTLPSVISFNNGLASANNLGIFSLRGVSGKDEFHYKAYSKFLEIQNDLPKHHPLRKFSYYTKVLNAIYALQKDGSAPKKLHPILILEKPLEGYVLTTENVVSLNVGTIYEVVSGQIVHNGIPYAAGQTFTAINSTFTGTGIVQYKNQKRPMTNNDPYPFSASQLEIIIMKIVTQEFGVEATKVADIRNDSQDSTRALNA